MKRSTESVLDLLGEADEDTEGEAAVETVTLRVDEDRLNEIAAYCEFPPAKTIESGRMTWRQTTGLYRGVVVTLKTKERRRKTAAA